jgi:hypothetical protein
MCLTARAGASGAIDVAELLCAAGAAVDPVDREGRPLEHGPLGFVAEGGSLAMARLIPRTWLRRSVDWLGSRSDRTFSLRSNRRSPPICRFGRGSAVEACELPTKVPQVMDRTIRPVARLRRNRRHRARKREP